MNRPASNEEQFIRVRSILAGCVGEGRAVTIAQLVDLAGLPGRRPAEELLETRLADFPWPIVSGARGYYRPTSADDLNHYMASLQSRAVKVFMRRRTVLRKAVAAGFPRAGKGVANPPAAQGVLEL